MADLCERRTRYIQKYRDEGKTCYRQYAWDLVQYKGKPYWQLVDWRPSMHTRVTKQVTDVQFINDGTRLRLPDSPKVGFPRQ